MGGTGIAESEDASIAPCLVHFLRVHYYDIFRTLKESSPLVFSFHN